MPVERLEEVIEEVKLVPDEVKKKGRQERYRHYAPLIPYYYGKTFCGIVLS